MTLALKVPYFEHPDRGEKFLAFCEFFKREINGIHEIKKVVATNLAVNIFCNSAPPPPSPQPEEK